MTRVESTLLVVVSLLRHVPPPLPHSPSLSLTLPHTVLWLPNRELTTRGVDSWGWLVLVRTAGVRVFFRVNVGCLVSQCEKRDEFFGVFCCAVVWCCCVVLRLCFVLNNCFVGLLDTVLWCGVVLCE